MTDKQVYGGELREKERRNGLHAVVRGSSEEARAVRKGMRFAASLSPRTWVTSGPGLLPMALSGSATSGVYVDIHDPCCH